MKLLKIIKDGRIVATTIKGNNEDDTKFNQENIEALNTIVETICKYQKIEELAEYHMLRFLPKERMSKFQKDILEVLEDGNDK